MAEEETAYVQAMLRRAGVRVSDEEAAALAAMTPPPDPPRWPQKHTEPQLVQRTEPWGA